MKIKEKTEMRKRKQGMGGKRKGEVCSAFFLAGGGGGADKKT